MSPFKGSRARGNRSSKAKIEERQARMARMMNENKTKSEMADELGVSRITLWRDLDKMEALFASENYELIRELKEKVGQALLQAADRVWQGKVQPEVANAWRNIVSDFSKLTGLNAETKSVVAHISSESSPLYLRFKKAIAGLSADQLEEGFTHLAALPREAQAQTVDASWFPQPDKKRLEGE